MSGSRAQIFSLNRNLNGLYNQDFVLSELDTDPEVKQSTCNTVALSKVTDSHIFDVLFDKYSDRHKLVRLCCWLIRCKRKWQSLARKSKQVSSDRLGNITVLPLSVEELSAAKRLLYAHMQSRFYEKEIHFLRNGKQIPRSSNVRRLDPKFIDGLMRVGGRLSKARLSETQKHLVLLFLDHPVARLILFHIHNKLLTVTVAENTFCLRCVKFYESLKQIQ